MIRTVWQKRHRLNLWVWLARNEKAWMRCIDGLSKVKERVTDIDKRLKRLETMAFGYGPPTETGSDPVQIIRFEAEKKGSTHDS